jgi:hypothetical protein
MSSWKQKKEWRKRSQRQWIELGCNDHWQKYIDVIRFNISFSPRVMRGISSYIGEGVPEGPGDKIGKGPSTLERELFKNIRGIYK